MDLDSTMNLDSTLPQAEYLGCQKCLKGSRMVVSSHKIVCKNQWNKTQDRGKKWFIKGGQIGFQKTN